ncbi:MAG: alkaline phosphatase family protein [Paludibacteraceae bacterium]|nr:alkaline phosphatase family protein [Paludibacteraceae bacterium]
MRKISIYYSLVIGLLLCAVTLSAAPRLTIVAVVDGLSTESLNTLRPYWQKGGLRTLNEEAYQTSIAFPHLVYGGNETTATLVTGATPDRHGYTMDAYLQRRGRNVRTMLTDESVRGIGTSLHLSAQDLLTPTMTDRMRLQYPEAKIYAIGIQPQATVLLAGHAANACCWIDPETKQWVATGAYKEGLPSAAYEQNKNGRVNDMASHLWTPRMAIQTYNYPTAQEKKKSFSYDVSKVLTHSPEANTLVIELALAIQQSEKLGMDATPDMLMLHLNSLSPAAKSDRIASAEHEDMYLWLNQDLGYLMEQLDRRIGHTNYQILVVGRPVLGTDSHQLEEIHMPVQRFNVDRAAALTGTYLMALYGHERWIDGAYGQSIYLNRSLIEQKRLNLETIQRQVANFLMDFEGVQIAMPSHEAVRYPLLGTSLCKRHTGDVVFMLQPNWQLMQDDNNTIDFVIDEKPVVPLLLWSGTLRPMPQEALDATHVADLIFQ